MVEHRTLTPLVLVRIQLPQPPFASAMLWVAGHPMQSSYREGVSHEVLTKCDEIEIKIDNPANKGGFLFVFYYFHQVRKFRFRK